MAGVAYVAPSACGFAWSEEFEPVLGRYPGDV
jgi:hypothetical protein